MTAKPTMFAQQPARAAPPARPVSESAAQMAADEIGRVSAMPTTTEMMMPMMNGCCRVAHMMMPPIQLAALPMGAATSTASPTPTRIVTMGVTRMSTFVSLETALPNSAATTAVTSTASGPPAPPMAFVANPTGTSENSTIAGACSA